MAGVQATSRTRRRTALRRANVDDNSNESEGESTGSEVVVEDADSVEDQKSNRPSGRRISGRTKRKGLAEKYAEDSESDVIMEDAGDEESNPKRGRSSRSQKSFEARRGRSRSAKSRAKASPVVEVDDVSDDEDEAEASVKPGRARRTSSRATKFKKSMREPKADSIQDLFAKQVEMAASATSSARGRRKSKRSIDDDESDYGGKGEVKKSARTNSRRSSASEYSDESKPNKSSRGRRSNRTSTSLVDYSEAYDDDDFEVAPKRGPSSARRKSNKNVKSPARHHNQARLRFKKPTRQLSDEDSEDDASSEESVKSDEEEPFKIQRILAARSETRRAWSEICKTMNTSEIDYGSRWYQDNKLDENSAETYEERFLVKWNDTSFLHCSWEAEKDLMDCLEGAKTYLSTFFRKSDNGYLFSLDERCDGDYFDPAYTQVERILEVKGGPLDINTALNRKNALEKEDTLTHEDLGIITNKSDPEFDNGTGRQFMIKWCNQGYSDCTFEFERDLIINDIEYKDKLKDFLGRRTKPTVSIMRQKLKSGDEEHRRLYKVFGANANLSDKKREEGAQAFQKSLEEIVFKNGGQLRDYQAEGVAWMVQNFTNKRCSILADEMGLGKTIQTASFINLLATKLRRHGPYLIAAPLSTLSHWYREFTGWTDLNTIIYHGSADDRKIIRELEMAYECDRPTSKAVGLRQHYLRKCIPNRCTRVTSPWMVQVVITTPEMLCADDYGELTCVNWEAVVVDEAHRLKNHNSKFATNLRDSRFKFGHKLLLTGTPIQNDVKEFWTLMNFIEPEEFSDLDNFMDRYGDMKSKERIDELHDVIRDYILRRLKEDVEKSVPPKEETLIEVELTISQKQYYRALYEKNVSFLHKNKKKALDGPSLNNLAMQLRKCCNHLFLLNGVEVDERAKQSEVDKSMTEGDFLVNGSGKLVLLDKLLPRLKENGHRVLIFSQFKIMLDILEDYFHVRTMKFERIDGSITGKKRQQAIDRFQAPPTEGREPPFIMMLSTRAGGVGINLTAADTCIIFDSDWNPQNDLQAQARCHRIGQTKSVKVYRLLTSKTYEMQMFHMSSLKMGLDQAVLQGFESSASGDTAMSKEEVEKLLRHGAYDIFNEEKTGTAEAESNDFVQQDIDSILERRSRTVVHDNTGSKSNAAGGTFSKARFTAKSSDDKKGKESGENAEEDVDIEDPEFWKKMVGEAPVEDLEDDLPAKRRKRTHTNYSEVDYHKRINESLLSSEDFSDDESSDDDSFDEFGYGQRERSKWGGRNGDGWRKENVKKLVTLMHSFGYGNIQWGHFAEKLELPKGYTEREVKRMSWSILFTTLLEACEDDVASAMKRERNAASRDTDADGQGGVLAEDQASIDGAYNRHLKKRFDKLWNTHVCWAKGALAEAVYFAQLSQPRPQETIEKKLNKYGSLGRQHLQEPPQGQQPKKINMTTLFVENVWPSLRSRGWKAVVLTDGPNQGKTQYLFDDKQYTKTEDVLSAAKTAHPELSKQVDQMMGAAESSRQESLKSEAGLRNRHVSLNHKNIDAGTLYEFMKKYAPLQLLFDRSQPRRILLSRKMLNIASHLHTANALVRTADKIPGTGDIVERLSNIVTIDKRFALPHPLWTNKHDAVLIAAIAKHGWIDNEDSVRAITNDSEIKWGFPFDEDSANKSSVGDGSSQKEHVDALRQTAERAAKFFNLQGSTLEDIKGFNQHLVISAYGLIRQAGDDGETQPLWSVDDEKLMASTGLKSATDATHEPAELPTKKDLWKRAKTVLTRCAEAGPSVNLQSANQSQNTTVEISKQNASESRSCSKFCVIDQSERCNLLLAEMLRGVMKLPYPKMSKVSRLLCSLAHDEAAKQHESILASFDATVGKKKADEMDKIAKQIALVKRNLSHTRQAKNVLRVTLGLDALPPRNEKESVFPSENTKMDLPKPRRTGEQGSSNKQYDGATGEKAISRSIKKVFDSNGGAPGPVPLQEKLTELPLTAIETLLLSVMCCQGFPVWTEDWASVFFGSREDDLVSPGHKYTLIWAGLGNVLETAAKDWHDGSKAKVAESEEQFSKFEDQPDSPQKLRAKKNLEVAKFIEKVKGLAAAQAADYAADPPTLARKTIMLLERLRLSMGNVNVTVKNAKKQNHGLGCKVLLWFGNQLSSWAKSLEVVDDVKKTLSYTAIDFFHDLPADEKEAIDVVSSLTKNDCRNVISQIALLVRARSVFLKYNEADMTTKLEKAAKNSRNCGDIWEKQPSWWGQSANQSQGYNIKHDALLISSLLEFGFGGVLENSRGFFVGNVDDDSPSYSLKELGITKASVQERANQVVRELDSLEGSEELIRLLAERKKKPALADPKCTAEGDTQTISAKTGCQKGLRAFFTKTSMVDKENVVVLSDAEYSDSEVQKTRGTNPKIRKKDDTAVICIEESPPKRTKTS